MFPGVIEKILVPIAVVIIGWIFKAPVMRWMHVRTLRKLEEAETDMRVESISSRWGSGKIIDVDPVKRLFPLSQIARRAGVSLWRAKWAWHWRREQELYKKISGK